MEKKKRELRSYFFRSVLLYFLADSVYLLFAFVLIFPMLLLGSVALAILTTAVYIVGVILGSAFIVKKTDNIFIYPAGAMVVELVYDLYETVKYTIEAFAEKESVFDVIKEYLHCLYGNLKTFAFLLALSAIIKYIFNRKKKEEE